MSEIIQLPKPEDDMGLSGAVRSENLRQEDRLKIAIVGEPKTGKSWLAATAPQPVLVFDFDDRAESLAGKPGLIIRRKPSITQVHTDLSNMKARKYNNQKIPSTFVFDSVTYMQGAMEAELLSSSPGLFRDVKMGGQVIKLRENWDVTNSILDRMRYFIAEFSLLGNVVFVYHERPEKDKTKSTARETVYTGETTVDPQYLAVTLSLFNEVYRITVDYTGKFTVQCKQSYEFKASTTMVELDSNEPPSIADMISKHRRLRDKKTGA
jgi:hypothetical protein